MKKPPSKKKKKITLPRQFWTMKPVTKIKQSKKAEISKSACRSKPTDPPLRDG